MDFWMESETLEMPAGKADLHQTRPLESCALPHHRVPAAQRNPSRQPFHPHAPPLRHPRVQAVRPLATLALAPLNISARPQRAPTPISAPDPDTSTVTTRPAHTARPPTIPMPADDGDQYRVLVVADDSPLPGPPNIDRP